MGATVWIGLWAVLFLASHLIISSSAVRFRVISAVGEQPYRGIYSLIAFATLGPLIYEFARNKHAGPLLRALPRARDHRRDASGPAQDSRARRSLSRVRREDVVRAVRGANRRARSMD